MAATRSRSKRHQFFHALKVTTLFALATFTMIGYQNCMGQKVDLSSTTPGASTITGCAPTAAELSAYTNADADIQTNCVACHADLSNTASASFRLYSAVSGDMNAASEDYCSILTMTPTRVYGNITSAGVHPFHADTANSPNLLPWLQSM